MTTGGRFREARDAFTTLVDLSGPERRARLAALESSDPELAEAVRKLLESDAKAEGFLEDAAPERLAALGDATGAADALEEPATPVGERVGPYRTVRPLGRGGMGEVFLAERVDGEFEQRVALKLVKRGRRSEPLRVDFTLARGVWAEGRVTDRRTGKPVRAVIEYYADTRNPHLKDHPDLPGRGLALPDQDAQGGAFPGSVWSQQPEQLTGKQFQIQSIHRHEGAVTDL